MRNARDILNVLFFFRKYLFHFFFPLQIFIRVVIGHDAVFSIILGKAFKDKESKVIITVDEKSCIAAL